MFPQVKFCQDYAVLSEPLLFTCTLSTLFCNSQLMFCFRYGNIMKTFFILDVMIFPSQEQIVFSFQKQVSFFYFFVICNSSKSLSGVQDNIVNSKYFKRLYDIQTLLFTNLKTNTQIHAIYVKGFTVVAVEWFNKL